MEDLPPVIDTALKDPLELALAGFAPPVAIVIRRISRVHGRNLPFTLPLSVRLPPDEGASVDVFPGSRRRPAMRFLVRPGRDAVLVRNLCRIRWVVKAIRQADCDPDRAAPARTCAASESRRRRASGTGTDFGKCLSTHTRVITSEAFWPPKPKLLEMAVRSGISREVLGT